MHLKAGLAPLLGAALASCAHHTPNFVGEYRFCDYACISVTIAEEGSFLFSGGGDVGPSPDVHGSWEALAPNLLLANSDRQPRTAPLSMSTDRSTEGISVLVVDEQRTPLPGADVLIFCGQEESGRRSTTGSSGIAAFRASPLKSLAVSLPGFHDLGYQVPSPELNTFVVMLDIDYGFITDELWLIHDEKLYFLSHEPLVRER